MIAKGQKYSDVTVYLDGSSFYDCTFERCTVVFSSVLPMTLHNPRFIDCKWQATGPAEQTINFMSALYKVGARELIDATFRTIRGEK